jgi:hypothetical protein
MCQTINIEKKIKQGSQIMVAHIMMINPVQQKTVVIQHELDHILQQYVNIFAEPTSLPPQHHCDHQIVLTPGTKPINLKPYRYSHF